LPIGNTFNPKEHSRKQKYVNFPQNAWVGATVDEQKRVKEAERIFSTLKATVKFVSLEPLLGPVKFSHPEVFDWFIFGGQSISNGPPIQPEWGWVADLVCQARRAGAKMYFKPNLTVRPKEYPT
jgi:protein gp37